MSNYLRYFKTWKQKVLSLSASFYSWFILDAKGEQDELRIADKYKDAIRTLQVAERGLRPIEDADMIALVQKQKSALMEKLKAVAGTPLIQRVCVSSECVYLLQIKHELGLTRVKSRPASP